MTKTTGRWLSRLADIATVVLAVLAAIYFFRGQRDWPVSPEPAADLEAGKYIQPISLLSPDGDVREVRLDQGRPTLLYAFRTTCQYCGQTKDMWQAIAQEAPHSAEVLAIGLDSDVSKVFSYFTDPRIHTFGTPYGGQQLMGSLPIHAVPLTAVVDGEGRIVRTWVGVLDRRARAEIVRLLESE